MRAGAQPERTPTPHRSLLPQESTSMPDATYGYRRSGKNGDTLAEEHGLTYRDLLEALQRFQRKAYWRFVNEGITSHRKGTITFEVIV